jgi:hypothetical protein
MSQVDTAHAWWSRLRHNGLFLSPVVILERYPSAAEPAPWAATNKLRDAQTRFTAKVAAEGEPKLDEESILAWVDALLDGYLGHKWGRMVRQNSIPEKLTTVVRIGSRSETIRPHRVIYADANATVPALMVMADTSAQVGRGRGRTSYARFLELLRGTGHRLGLLTNGFQFRLVYAGLDFESWCEWESERWFDDGEGSEELAGLRQLLSPDSLKPVTEGVSGLLAAVEESRNRQARLSDFLQENVREAIEFILEDVSKESRTTLGLFTSLVRHGTDDSLTDTQANEALYQATVRLIMRLVVCLFAESRPELRFNGPIYDDSYGVRTLYERLEEAVRFEGGVHSLFNQDTAWPRLMALFRLIHDGSLHPDLMFPERGGLLFRPGSSESSDPVARALHILEALVPVSDSTIHAVLRKLLRAKLPVIRGRTKTWVEGPVDFSDLRTQVIGLIYEGLLDYRLKRTDEALGPMVFLNIGRQPVLPLGRLEDMLAHDRSGLKNLLTTLRKEQVTASAKDEDEESPDEDEQAEEPEELGEEEPSEEVDSVEMDGSRAVEYLAAEEAARRWARDAAVLAGMVGRQRARETDSEYQARLDAEVAKVIKRVTVLGEFYLVRAGNTRKGSGTFYTRPELAVPTAHRTLEPLCYDKAEDGTLIPKKPEVILALKVCDIACGSASFLVAGLDYLTDALFRSLRHHRHLDDPDVANTLTLPLGTPRTGSSNEEVVKFPPNDPYYGDNFEAWVTARLRRYVVERCIYGVDINPLAVELARVSLWIATLDPGLPFSFLDHKIKVGNSLVGCWLDRVEDYPLKAWEREGGDGKNGERTGRIETFLKGEKVGNRRSGDGRIKQEMRRLIETRFQGYQSFLEQPDHRPLDVVARLRDEYQKLHDQPIHDSGVQETRYQEIEASEPRRALKAAMDEWCAVWFWPTDEESLRHVPTPETFLSGSSESRAAITRQLATDSKFFHWELEFPDVFTPDRSGFDALTGNPPWDVIEAKSQEFFSDTDPLYRTYDNRTAISRQEELLRSVTGLNESWCGYNANFKALGNWVRNGADPFDLSIGRGKEGLSHASAWAKRRKLRAGLAAPYHPYHLIGGGKLNAYKLFAEVFWSLLQPGGRIGIILPAGIYSDFGTKELREELLQNGRLDLLYAFQNEKKIFSAADHRFKQVTLFVTKGGHTEAFLTRFRMGVGDSPEAHELHDDLLRNDSAAMVFTPEDVRTNSPKSLSLVELRSPRDLAVFRKIYDNSIRIGDNAPGWEVTYAQEFNSTTDSRLFPTLDKWQSKGYEPDCFGRWRGPGETLAMPLYQGGMLHILNPFYNAWADRQWKELRPDVARPEPKFLMADNDFRNNAPTSERCRIAYRRIARTTDTRTFIGSFSPPLPSSDSLFLLLFAGNGIALPLKTMGVYSSLCFDWVVRQRLSGTNLSWFVIQECPVPLEIIESKGNSCASIGLYAGRLCLIHRRFAAEWLKLKQLHPALPTKEWKHWWGVTEADRLRLRVEIDALCADLYGLDPDDFDWIVRDDPTDPKGFYRVDRQLPFRERLTGLAAAAFRALKEGKWSAESAASLSNNEFFDLLGIPELTNAQVAHTKGLPGPLIEKRDGCHVWRPETFPADDPRHGWTWNDCWNDAVAFLGSEDDVRQYLECKPVEDTKNSGLQGQPKDLFGNPLQMSNQRKSKRR